MMMYDELIEGLRVIAKGETDKIFSEAADAIEELSKKLFYAELSEAHTLEIQKALRICYECKSGLKKLLYEESEET